MDELVVVASYESVFAARIAEAHLASEGIDSSVATDNAGGAFPSLTPLGSGARVVVRQADLARAHEALEGLDPAEFDSATE